MPLPGKIFCQKPWESLLIFADGRMRFCCFMAEDLGNLNWQTFKAIWNGPKARRIRRQFLAEQVPAECRFCPLVHEYAEVAKNSAAV